WSKKSAEKQKTEGEWLARLDEVLHTTQSAKEITKDQWDELRKLSQQLAEAYHRVGRPALKVVSAVPIRHVEVWPPQEAPAAAPTPTLPLLLLKHPIYHSILLALRNRKRFQVRESMAAAAFHFPILDTDRQGTCTLTMSAALFQNLGDHLVTTWL